MAVLRAETFAGDPSPAPRQEHGALPSLVLPLVAVIPQGQDGPGLEGQGPKTREGSDPASARLPSGTSSSLGTEFAFTICFGDQCK